MINACLRPNNNWRLIAYSESIFLIDSNNSLFSLHFGDNPQYFLDAKEELVRHIHGTLILYQKEWDFCDIIVSQTYKVLSDWWAEYISKKAYK